MSDSVENVGTRVLLCQSLAHTMIVSFLLSEYWCHFSLPGVEMGNQPNSLIYKILVGGATCVMHLLLK